MWFSLHFCKKRKLGKDMYIYIQYVEKGYENKPKFSCEGGGDFIHGLFGLKKVCNFFFTLIIHDKMVSIDDFCKIFSAPQNHMTTPH